MARLPERTYHPRDAPRPRRPTPKGGVDNRLSRLLLDGKITEGSRVTVHVRDDRLEFRTDQPT